ncbi:MAG: DUF4113 domain-containing protein [Comamonas sp.]|nr:DUF4113 domain-containing protein [Comamonas sp.]UBQ44502.1 DUF4113 domain-containing protein [Comamonas thiooxydans]
MATIDRINQRFSRGTVQLASLRVPETPKRRGIRQ